MICMVTYLIPMYVGRLELREQSKSSIETEETAPVSGCLSGNSTRRRPKYPTT